MLFTVQMQRQRENLTAANRFFRTALDNACKSLHGKTLRLRLAALGMTGKRSFRGYEVSDPLRGHRESSSL